MITVRFAHMASNPGYKPGDKIKRGDIIGKMGDTGVATAAHLHMDNAKGVIRDNWKLSDVEKGVIKPDPRELNKFVVPRLFDGSIRVTTPYCDYDYQETWGKVHYGYDLSTDENWPWPMFWPIRQGGVVTLCKKDDAYGWTLLVVYDSKEN